MALGWVVLVDTLRFTFALFVLQKIEHQRQIYHVSL
jgi:hypothetical protein